MKSLVNELFLQQQRNGRERHRSPVGGHQPIVSVPSYMPSVKPRDRRQAMANITEHATCHDFSDLPHDIWGKIFKHLPLQSRFAVFRTCWTLYDMRQIPWIWHDINIVLTTTYVTTWRPVDLYNEMGLPMSVRLHFCTLDSASKALLHKYGHHFLKVTLNFKCAYFEESSVDLLIARLANNKNLRLTINTDCQGLSLFWMSNIGLGRFAQAINSNNRARLAADPQARQAEISLHLILKYDFMANFFMYWRSFQWCTPSRSPFFNHVHSLTLQGELFPRDHSLLHPAELDGLEVEVLRANVFPEQYYASPTAYSVGRLNHLQHLWLGIANISNHLLTELATRNRKLQTLTIEVCTSDIYYQDRASPFGEVGRPSASGPAWMELTRACPKLRASFVVSCCFQEFENFVCVMSQGKIPLVSIEAHCSENHDFTFVLSVCRHYKKTIEQISCPKSSPGIKPLDEQPGELDDLTGTLELCPKLKKLTLNCYIRSEEDIERLATLRQWDVFEVDNIS